MGLFSRKSNGEQKAEMSFIEHIDELRKHLFRSVIAIILGAIVVHIFNEFIVSKILMGPTHSDFPTYTYLCKLGQKLSLGDMMCLSEIKVNMQSNSVAGQLSVYVNVLIIGGLIVAFPYVFWQFWKFIKPALKTNELKRTKGVIFWVSTVNFFANFSIDNNIQNIWTISSYFSTIVPLILGSGIAFQLPLVLYFLAKIDVISVAFLKKYRRHAIVIIVIAVSAITPPDMLSTIICSIPLVLLYEVSIMLCKRVEKQKLKEEGAKEWD
jgi:sec-independent protein translocase protein TatC